MVGVVQKKNKKREREQIVGKGVWKNEGEREIRSGGEMLMAAGQMPESSSQ